MKKYNPKANSPARVDYGTELCAGLARFPETAPLATDMASLDDQLFAQYLARLGTRKSLVNARVALRFADYDADQTLRGLARACEEADGTKGGPIFKSVFKDGLTAAVRPEGARQIPATEKIAKNLAESAVPGADAIRATWAPKVDGALTALSDAAAAQKAAKKAYDDAFSAEVALRNQHWIAVDRVQGQVRAAFPGNPAKQDLVFPELDDTRDEPAAPADVPKAAAAGNTPAKGDSPAPTDALDPAKSG